MRLTSLKITNFRGLANIDVSFDNPISVIVGPNAIGKTSILEAIRLVKSILAPRFPNEPTVTLSDMGAIAHDRLRFESLARDADKPIDVQITIKLAAEELAILERRKSQIAVSHARNVSAIPANIPDFGIAQFFSSPQGKAVLDRASAEVTERMTALKATPNISLHLIIDPTAVNIRGTDIFSQEFLTALDQFLPPAFAYVSYFPADRAMPTGEINIQLGAADALQQLHSHMGQPATKYNRLKNLIVTQTLLGDEPRKQLQEDFRIIFDTLLVGKHLHAVQVSPQGPLSVLIQEKATGKIFDIDRMSSGEKGLILQFLTMRRQTAPKGVILLDEPELHLNPAVCKQLIPFILDHVTGPSDAQAIMCTHSPEILAAAFDRADCSLFHLRSGSDISPVYKQDKEEIFEALKRLGATTSDVLFSKGTLFVEGSHDVDILEQGFPNRVSGFRIRRLHGRTEVEKEIATLQKAEKDEKLKDPQFFVFDKDRKPTSTTSSPLVRVQQWDRYCLENFLLDADAIYEVRNAIKANAPPESRGAVKTLLKELAMQQLQGVVVREVYSALEPDNPGIRPNEVDQASSYEAIGETLYNRLNRIAQQVSTLNKEAWIRDFTQKCTERGNALTPMWEDSWPSECDGKRVLVELHRKIQANVRMLELKKQIVNAMAQRQTENWRVVDSYLNELFAQ